MRKLKSRSCSLVGDLFRPEDVAATYSVQVTTSTLTPLARSYNPKQAVEPLGISDVITRRDGVWKHVYVNSLLLSYGLTSLIQEKLQSPQRVSKERRSQWLCGKDIILLRSFGPPYRLGNVVKHRIARDDLWAPKIPVHVDRLPGMRFPKTASSQLLPSNMKNSTLVGAL